METQALELAKGRKIEVIERNGDLWFTSEQIGIQLGYADPRKEINNLFKRNKNELEDYTGDIELMTPGGNQKVRVFSEQGLYIICMLARTDAAREFRRQVAALLKKRRHDKLREARMLGRKQGFQKALKFDRGRIDLIRRAAKYRKMGLVYRDIAKLINVGETKARKCVVEGRDLGLIGDRDGAPRGV